VIFGKLLGSIPTERAATNGLIIRHGYIVGEFGDTLRPNSAVTGPCLAFTGLDDRRSAIAQRAASDSAP
jgi:hypothetical protein